MERFMAEHPDVSFSSLPRYTATGTEVELGIAGTPENVNAGRRDLEEMLRAQDIHFTVVSSS
jgi:hypothetical protein